jgi:Asp-tRNA(Asn)/Glu-tRNA(Gln) amidotransferase A subunit family amidase
VNKDFSAAQAVIEAFAKLETHSALNIVTELNVKFARAMGARLDEVDPEERGPLHGMPLIVKANIAVAGCVMTAPVRCSRTTLRIRMPQWCGG